MGANQIVFWLSVRIFNSLSRRFKQRCRTRAKEIKEKHIPLLRWDTSDIFFDLKIIQMAVRAMSGRANVLQALVHADGIHLPFVPSIFS